MTPEVTVHPVTLSDDDLLQLCQVSAVGARGPGGQHVNKTQTGVVIRFGDSSVHAKADERRERQQNLRVALKRLRLQLAMHVRGGAHPRLLQGLRQGTRLPVKAAAASYALVVAVLLDALQEVDWQASPAAEACGITASQLRKALSCDGLVWQFVGKELTQRGLPMWRNGR